MLHQAEFTGIKCSRNGHFLIVIKLLVLYATSMNTDVISQEDKQTLPQANTAQPTSNLVSGLYWNGNRWKGTRTVPVVLELAHDKLVMYDRDDKQVFNVSLTIVQARFTRADSLHLTVNGVKYWLSGMGTAISPDFSPAQKTRLEEFNRSVRLLQGTIAASGVATAGLALHNMPAAGVADVAAGVMAFKAAHDEDKLLNKWYVALQQTGVQVTGKRAGMLKISIITFVVTIVLCIVMIFVIYAITSPK